MLNVPVVFIPPKLLLGVVVVGIIGLPKLVSWIPPPFLIPLKAAGVEVVPPKAGVEVVAPNPGVEVVPPRLRPDSIWFMAGGFGVALIPLFAGNAGFGFAAALQSIPELLV
jgi:hypothetical protein